MMLVGLAIPFADQPTPWLSWLLAGAAVVILGIAKSGFGSGVGIIAVPMFVFAFGSDSAGAIGALLPLLIAADVLSVLHHWGTWDRANLRVVAPGTAVGLIGGAAILWWLMGGPSLFDFGERAAAEADLGGTEQRLKIAIGVICVIYVVADQVKARLAPQFRLRPTYLSGSVTGVSAGVVTAIAHAAGPIMVMYLLGQRLAKQRFIGTAVIYFFTVNVIKQLTIYPALGLTRVETLWTGLWLLPLVPVGTWLGAKLNRVMPEKVFRTTILIIVAISGLQLVTGLNPLELLGL